jgi:geranylgeranyl diphosphate synthase type I
MTTTSPALSTLDRCRALTEPALRAAVDSMDPANRRISAYHLGWTEADGSPRLGSSGKALRPALALLSAQAAGAPASIGVPGAVAVELVHNFSLVHDDVMDGDLERRHRPAVWAVWGVSAAVLAGDAMLSLASQVLLAGLSGEGRSGHQSPPASASSLRKAQAAALLQLAVADLLRGQAEDLELEGRNEVALSECEQMTAGKTGALLAASSTIGAVLAGADPALVTALDGFGRHLGMAFQLLDDLLDIWGDPELTGKPAYSDLRSRKKSLPVAYALSDGNGHAAGIEEWLRGRGRTEDERYLRQIADLLEAAGARAWGQAEAARRLQAATEELNRAAIPDVAREELLGLARFCVEREV